MVGIAVIDSVPAPIAMSHWPVMIFIAASATALRPLAQKRFTVMPGTDTGRPASSRPMRATFMPCSPSGIAQPTTTSPMSFRSKAGTASTVPRSTCASMSSGRT